MPEFEILSVPNGASPPYAYAPPRDPWLVVLYMDNDILVLNKPSGLLSVPGKPVEHADCLEARAQAVYPGAMTIHRLDRDTSGLVVMGLNRRAHAHISLQFEKRRTGKSYVARVWGDVEGEAGEIDLPIACDWPNRPKQMVDHDKGRPARTIWEVMGRETSATRVRLTPLTGRSHQLRVHMLSLGHPILGDNFYAHPAALEATDRLQLHAEKLSFFHPADEMEREFVSICPF